MKSSRFRYSYRDNASKLHKKVGDLLRECDAFKNYESYQEYPVNKVNEEYAHGNHHFDWVIPTLQIVIECHGKQHYTPVAFDGDDEKAIENFKATQHRDKLKKAAALEAGYRYIEIPYSAVRFLDEDWILKALNSANEELNKFETDKSVQSQKAAEAAEKLAKEQAYKEEQARLRKEKREEYLQSKAHKEQLKKARAFRQAQYQKMKEWKKNNG